MRGDRVLRWWGRPLTRGPAPHLPFCAWSPFPSATRRGGKASHLGWTPLPRSTAAHRLHRLFIVRAADHGRQLARHSCRRPPGPRRRRGSRTSSRRPPSGSAMKPSRVMVAWMMTLPMADSGACCVGEECGAGGWVRGRGFACGLPVKRCHVHDVIPAQTGTQAALPRCPCV